MPILSSIQRRSPGGRTLVTVMYLLLIFGSVWMVYPFLLMISGSVKSNVDVRQMDIVPRYLYDNAALFRKYEEHRYNGNLDTFEALTRFRDGQGRPSFSFEFLPPPPDASPRLLQDYDEFLKELRKSSYYNMCLGHGSPYRSIGELVLEYRRRLTVAFPELPSSDIAGVQPPTEAWSSRQYSHIAGPFVPIYEEYRKGLDLRYFLPTSVEGDFVLMNLRGKYSADETGLKKLNESWGTGYKALFDVTMPRNPPTQPVQRTDWWEYVRDSLSTRFIRFAPSLLPKFQQYLQVKYKDIAGLNKVFMTSYTAWTQVQFPPPDASATFTDVQSFLQSMSGPDGISVDSSDFQWRDFLRAKYKDDIHAMNAACGTSYDSFDNVLMPVLAHDWKTMMEHRGEIIRDYLVRNYQVVWAAMSSQGRAFRNTIIFCTLSVLTALIVNPLAAYALSRFHPRWGYSALFVLMATMAFPGEVTQIPSFLMLREMGMLNTFAALIIPAAASGFSIFLLKGFFDSLPKDLYESATLDGASELRIFLTITIPLSAPILAVIALAAFTSAYGAFQFALLVCQKESMWTLMVHIYQLQANYGQPIVFASLVIAAIPTLLVFVFCQNIILRGIVVPVEK